MILTHDQRTLHDLNAFPTTQLFILAICRVAEPIALTSIFHYAWPMVKSFHDGDENNASFYAGILISSFALSESLTGMYWGSLSDRVGRKPILLLGCAGTMLSMLMMGFATNFWMALLGRALGGILNGNIGVIQTMVGELVKKPEHEPRAYAVMPFVWSIGTIIGPAIGGFFATPATSFPSFFSPTGVFATFPYLLPNLMCAGLLLISIVAGYLFLVETHPDMQPWSTLVDLNDFVVETPLMVTAGSTANAGADLRAESYGTFNRVDIYEEETWQVSADGSGLTSKSSEKDKTVFTRQVVMLVIALGIFTYHTMSYDHLLPIFLQDKKADDRTSGALHVPGGLGVTTQQVGVIMSINGLIALFIQAVVFPLFAEWLGVWKVFLMVSILHPIAYFIVPFIAVLPENLTSPSIYACLTVRNFFSILGYPVILILLKEACPRKSVLGKINGLAASAGAACRTVAPPIAGVLYDLGAKQGFAGLTWWCSGLVAVVGAIQIFWVEREKNKTSVVRVPCAVPPQEVEQETKEIVHIVVTEV